MASTVYSTLFVAQVIAGGVGATYSVPSGKVLVLRDMQLMPLEWESTYPDGISVSLDDSGDVGAFLVVDGPMALFGVQWEGHMVLNQESTIKWISTDAFWQIVCSGYLLTSP